MKNDRSELEYWKGEFVKHPIFFTIVIGIIIKSTFF
jgi:hypothetical protein